MKKAKQTDREKAAGAVNWRDLQNKGSGRRARSPVARKRSWMLALRATGVALFAGLLVGGVVYGVYFTRANFEKVSPVSQNMPLRQVVFETDGVLNGEWFRGRFAIEPETNIMDVRIHELKAQLEQEGQIARAEVSLRLPDTLIVQVMERKPVLRARLAGADGKPRTVLIGEDGVVYEGTRYPQSTIRSLPGVAGIRLRRSDDGFERVDGMEHVAEFLRTAREAWPEIYRDWKYISLADFNPDPLHPKTLITARGEYVDTAVFAARDFNNQFARLHALMNYSMSQQERGIELADLSLGSQTVARF